MNSPGGIKERLNPIAVSTIIEESHGGSHLDNIVSPLIREFTFSDFQNSLLEHPFPSHELQSKSENI
jgi:hypothetical protein